MLSGKIPLFLSKTALASAPRRAIARCSVDNCNFFDEWQKDREKYNITSEAFGWSPDDPCLDSEITLAGAQAKDIYNTELRDKYIDCAKLNPVNQTMEIENGVLVFNNVIQGNSAVFYEITFE